MEIRKLLIDKNYTKDKKITPKYIVIHYTANPGASAYNHYVYFNREYVGVSAHYFVDTKEIVQILEDNWYGWHCGAKTYKHLECRNSNSIGIEMCIEKDWSLSEIVVEKTIQLTRMLMKKYNIPVNNVLRHYDVTGKNCPAPFVQNPARWEDFLARLVDTEDIQKINKKMQVTATELNVRTLPSTNGKILGTLKNGEIIDVTGVVNNWYQFMYKNQIAYCSGVYLKEYKEAMGKKPLQETKPSTQLYRVRKSWEDAKSQIGAYTVFENAKKQADKNKGYQVYDEKGNQVYPPITEKPVENKPISETFLVKVTASTLNIRQGPGTNYDIKGVIRDKGVYTIVETKDNWGRLKSGAGWISLKYTERLDKKPAQTQKTLKVGSKVKVKKGAKTFDGKNLASFVYNQIYDVIQINGNRIVIGKGKIVTAAIHKDNLILL